MEINKRYTVRVSDEAILDIENAGDYIGVQFQYAQLVSSFFDKMNKVLESLTLLPGRLQPTGFKLDGEPIYMRAFQGYMFL